MSIDLTSVGAYLRYLTGIFSLTAYGIQMDDILCKNIFHDDDLRKLSPDYSPTDLTLRMQVRRTMVSTKSCLYLLIFGCHHVEIYLLGNS